MQSQNFESNSQSESSLPSAQRHRINFSVGSLRQRLGRPLCYPLLMLGLAGAVGTVTVGTIAPCAQAASLTNWSFDPSANQLEITVKEGTTPRYFLMAQPARIVVDLPDTSIGSVTPQQTYSGAIRQIRVSQFQPGLTRIVMELSPDIALAPGQVQLQKVDDAKSTSSRWTLRPLIASAAAGASVSSKAPSPKTPAPAKNPAPLVPIAVAEPSSASSAATTSPGSPSRSTSASVPSGKPSAANPPSAPPVPAKVSAPVEDTAKQPIAPVEPDPPARAASANHSSNSRTSAAINADSKQDAPPQPPTTSITNTASPDRSIPVRTRQEPTPDPDVAVNTAGAIAIAVPPPVSALSSSPASSVRPSLAPTLDSPKPIAPETKPTPEIVAPQPVQPAQTPAAVAPAIPTSNTPASLEIPTTLAAVPASAPRVSVPPLVRQEAAPSNPAVQPASQVAPAPQPTNREAIEIPSTLPSAAVSSTQSASVRVPPVGAVAQVEPATQTLPIGDSGSTPMTPSVSVPPLQPIVSPAPTVSVPALQPMAPPAPALEVIPSSPVQEPIVRPAQATVVEFGQPLPSAPLPQSRQFPSQSQINRSNGLQQVLVPQSPAVLLPAGTLLTLQYPGGKALNLRTNSPHQEVLLLQTEIRDALGRVIAPEGSMVLGRFETSSSGSRFVTQAIALQRGNVPFVAQSDNLAGSRQVSDNQVALNSGIGAVAGGVLGGISGSAGLGALGGAATGAAVALLTSPKPATIQPGQVVQVRLLQDWR